MTDPSRRILNHAETELEREERIQEQERLAALKRALQRDRLTSASESKKEEAPEPDPEPEPRKQASPELVVAKETSVKGGGHAQQPSRSPARKPQRRRRKQQRRKGLTTTERQLAIAVGLICLLGAAHE